MAKTNKTVKALMELLSVSEEVAKLLIALAAQIATETAGSSDEDEDEDSEDEDEESDDEDSDDEDSDDEDEDEDSDDEESDDEDEDSEDSDDEDEDSDDEDSDDEDSDDEDEDSDDEDSDDEDSDDEESEDGDDEDAEEEEEAEGYAALNFKQLKKQAKDRGIDVPGVIGKAKSEAAQIKKLITALEELDAAVDALHKKKVTVLEKLAAKHKIKWSKPRGRASEDKIKAAIVEALVANGIFG